MDKDVSRESSIRARLFFKLANMKAIKKALGLKPKFTDNELTAMKVLSTIYLDGVDWEKGDTDPVVKNTLESIKEKVKDY